MSIENKEQFDLDTQWKELIGDLFEEWTHFFAPELAVLIDFCKPPEFLDKEFPKIIPEYFKGGSNFNDKLVKVFLKSGDERFLLIHIEVQAQPEANFPERMFKYFYRLYDRFGKHIDATAIFTDELKTYCPDTFEYEMFNTKLTYKYRVYKTAIQNEEELLNNPNPFALAVLATQYMHKTKRKTDAEKRLQFKHHLVRLLFERGYKKEKIGKILLFIANILILPKLMEYTYRNELAENLKKQKDMPLTLENSIWGQLYKEEWKEEGLREGIEQGIEQGATKEKYIVALNMMRKDYTDEQVVDITNLNLQQVLIVRQKYNELGEAAYQWVDEEFLKKRKQL